MCNNAKIGLTSISSIVVTSACISLTSLFLIRIILVV